MGRTRSSVAIFFLLCGSLLLTSTTLTEAHTSIETIIPANLTIPEGHNVQQFLLGVGAQIYKYNGSTWVLNNVSADLFNFKGVRVGHHFFLTEEDSNGGQPSWESFHPYSRVTGKAVDSLTQMGAIPLVLLEATSNAGSLKVFGSTNFVQRLFTRNGLPPANEMSANVGDLFYSNYSALYGFSV